jgi:putative inorganic carbon (HCO3(-)) transporter
MTGLSQRWPLTAGLLSAAAAGVWAGIDPSALQLDPVRDPRALVVGLLAVLLAVGLMLRPAVGLVVFSATVYLNLSQVLVRQHDFPSLLQLLSLPLLVAAWVELRSHAHKVPRGLIVLTVAYPLGILLSTTVALDHALADARLMEALRGMIVVLVVVLLATTRDRVRATAATLAAAAVFLALLGTIQSLTGDYANTFGGLARVKHAQIYGSVFEPRIAGPLGDPNFFAQMLLVVVPLTLFEAWEGIQRRQRVIAWLATGAIVSGIVLTYSRGGAIALGLVLVLALLAHGIRPRRVLVSSAIVVAGLAVAPTGFRERLVTVTELLPGEDDAVLNRDSSFEERLLLGHVAWEMFASHPLRGVGAGNYTVRFDEYADRVPSAARDYEVDAEDRYAHNLFLELGAEGGLPLLGTFCVFMIWVLASLVRSRRLFQDAGDRPMAAIATAVALGLVGYLTSSVFLHGAFQRYLWLLVGLAGALYALARRATDTPESGTDGWAVATAEPGSGSGS